MDIRQAADMPTPRDSTEREPGACKHMNFDATVSVARIEDVGRFVAEVKIHCTECGTPFQFLGLQPGFNYEHPTVRLDGLEADLPICPQGVQLNPLQKLQGFTIERYN